MRSHVNEWVDQFPNFHTLDELQQIVRLAYFHTIEEKRETVSKPELERLFDFIDTPVPENLGQKLAYLCGKGARLVAKNGEYSLRREIRQSIEKDLEEITGRGSPPKLAPYLRSTFPEKPSPT